MHDAAPSTADPDESQYGWLKQRAGIRDSIAAVVCDLIESERTKRSSTIGDPLLSYLSDEPAATGMVNSTVETLDRDLYG